MDDNSPQDDDWRLMGQDKYLQGVGLSWQRYSRNSQNWDHDHCEFCGAKFMVEDILDVLHEGYTTPDQYHWICETCYVDFKDRFRWE